MTLPSSGPLSISQIASELGVSSNTSLRSLSSLASKSAPDSFSEFYGYTKPSLGAGYIAGGATTTGNNDTTAVDKISYSTGVWSANGSSLASGRIHPGCVSDGSSYGYIAGGYNLGAVGTSSIERITFSTSTFAANTAGTLSDNRYGCQGLSDRSSYGYFCLGYNYQPSTNAYTTKVDKITFSTSAVSAGTAGSVNRRYQASINGTSYGYLCAGHSGTAYISAVHNFSYSTGTMSTGGNVYGAVIMGGGLSNGSTYGYFCGGYNGTTYYATTSRIQFSTNTVSTYSTSNLTSTRARTFYGVSDATYGYIGGGMSNSSTLVTTSDRMTFSTEVFAANPYSMTSAHQMPGGLSSTGF